MIKKTKQKNLNRSRVSIFHNRKKEKNGCFVLSRGNFLIIFSVGAAPTPAKPYDVSDTLILYRIGNLRQLTGDKDSRRVGLTV